MAVTFVDNRGILNEADAITGWNGGSVTVYTANPSPAEASGCLGLVVSTTTVEAYLSITSDDYSNGGTISIWVQDNGAMDTLVNGGIQIIAGDGTNRIGYHVGGSDKGGYRHQEGPVKWQQFVLDLANKPANSTAFAGSEANLDETAITVIGVAFKTLSKALGNTDNCFFDIIRFADNGVDIEVYGGTSGTPESLATAAATDRSTANQAAHGAIREFADGTYGIHANISLGDKTSTNDTYIDIIGETLAWEAELLGANNYYRFNTVGNATGTTVINIVNSTLNVPAASSASMDMSDTNSTVNLNGCLVQGFDQGIVTGLVSTDWRNNSFISCGQITLSGADFRGCSVSGYEGTADTSALIYNETADPDGELDNCTFTKGTASTHAIEFGTSSPTTMTLRGIDFSGYNATNGQTDSTLHIKRTAGTVTINLVGCTGNISYKSDGATVVLVRNPVAVTVTVKDESTDAAIQYAAVTIKAAATTGGLPFKASVTIVQSGGTATVTHSNHGLETGQKVEIEGANENNYNRIKTITVTGTNTYTYPIDSGTSSPATGTITATAIIIDGETDASGQISDTRSYSVDQNYTGLIQQGTRIPLYKARPVSGLIDKDVGLPLNVLLTKD
jgi:hypothetical protein